MREYLYGLATDRTAGFTAGIIKVFLFALSLIYGLAVRALYFFNRFLLRRLNCTVISVGNITLGGTGKTSLVEYIAGYLKQHGHSVAILTRGYKRKAKDQGEGALSCENMGDEPYMLQMNLKDVPIVVGADRVSSGRQAIGDYGADTVVLDDGMQQWRIKKDLEIVTIDAVNPFGNRQMIPRGILREPVSSLKRADVFVLTKTNLNADTNYIKDTLSKLNPSAVIVESIHKPLGFYSIDKPEGLLDTALLKGKTVTLFSGIGDPDSFENLIRGLGINAGLSFKFPDHHNYTLQDLDKIIKSSRDKNIDTIITTQKDAARLYAPGALRFLVLRIGMVIKDEQRFHNRLLKLYSL
ncbi:MAG: tetraacyldisaccharide 4'-kinase [Candidatus Omnitrophota bacterium]